MTMKRIRMMSDMLIRSLLAGLCLWSVGSPAFAASPCAVALGWESWPPFQYRDDTDQITGVDIDLIQAIFANMGCALTFSERPWKRQIIEAQEGRIDMLVAAPFDEEWTTWGYFSAPYRTGTNVLLVLKGTSIKYPFTSFEEMLNYDFTLGIVRGTTHGEQFQHAMTSPEFQARVEEVTTDEQNIQKLLTERIEGILIGEVTAGLLAQRMNIREQVEIHPLPVVSAEVYAVFGRQTMTLEIVERFNRSLAELKARGDYDKVLQKYGLISRSVKETKER